MPAHGEGGVTGLHMLRLAGDGRLRGKEGEPVLGDGPASAQSEEKEVEKPEEATENDLTQEGPYSP